MPLSGIRGNREVVAGLLAELSRRPSHAYLFSGPAGVGKATIAAALGHSMLCERSPGAGFCCNPENCAVRNAPAQPAARGRRQATAGETPRCECCPACVQIASGVHPDFIHIGRAAGRTDVLIEQVRELIAELGIKPSRAGVRVAIIDDAETLNLPAQNALLKTLEEPPGHTIIFMITSAERALLDTVRSRMRPVRFGALTVADLEATLADHGVSDTGRRSAAARLARGSAARAIALAEGDEPPMKEMLDALGRARGMDFPAVQQLAQRHFQNRDQAAENFELIARLLEEILCLKLLGAKHATAGGKAAAELARTLEPRAIVACMEGAVKAHGAVEAMANPRMQAEQFWMNAARAIRGE